MNVCLRGSSPAATTAGIMLITRARQLGLPIDVTIVGDPDALTPVPGPAVCYAPVVASCGVGRGVGVGATMVVSGPPSEPLMVSVHPHGESGWFFVDRSGVGHHPATQAFVRLAADSRPEARALGKTLRRAMEVLGLSTDPAVLDVLFGADVPPLSRLAVGLRTGRVFSGGRGEPITRFLSGHAVGEPLDADTPADRWAAVTQPESLRWLLNGLSTAIRDAAEEVIAAFHALAEEDGGRDIVLLFYLAELASHLMQLPAHSILPPLGAAEDSVATAIRDAMTSEGEGDANRQLVKVFRFLGGKFTRDDTHAHEVSAGIPPDDHVGRWRWFCAEVRRGRKQADALWPTLVDPPC